MINLLPPKRLLDIKTARGNTVLRRYVELVIFGMIILAVAVTASYYFLHRQQQNVKTTLQADQQKVQELQPIQKEAEELSATVNTISGLLSRNVKFSEMLTKIGGVMPNGAVLTGLQFSIEDLDSPLVISAQVEDEARAAVLRNNLIASGLFSSADIKTISLLEDEEEDEAAAPAQPPAEGTPAPASAPNPYRYSTTISAYFKAPSEAKP